MARHLIDYGGVGFVQIDCGRIGGIGPAKRVADYAVAKGVTYVNHTFTSHLALSASLQPYAGLADHRICEFPAAPKPLALRIHGEPSGARWQRRDRGTGRAGPRHRHRAGRNPQVPRRRRDQGRGTDALCDTGARMTTTRRSYAIRLRRSSIMPDDFRVRRGDGERPRIRATALSRAPSSRAGLGNLWAAHRS